jgi:hypothetical protein
MEINLEALLGTLAAYFAIMAVLAVGTEVALDILKIKALAKPTSPSEALAEFQAELKEWMPEKDWNNLEQRAEKMEHVIRDLDNTLTKTRSGLGRLRQQAKPVLTEIDKLAPTDVATVMRELEARYQAITDNRIAWIRFWSLVIGIVWAVILQINSLDLLGPVIPNAVDNLLGGRDTLWYSVAGLALSGLGAAAGSSFWYEQMARLRQARQVVSTTEELRAQVEALAAGQASTEK